LPNARRTSFSCGLLLFTASVGIAASFAGRVHDGDGRPLPDVAISAAAKTRVYSNGKGEFSLDAGSAAGPVKLLFELPGYYPESVTCDARGGAALDVALTPRAVVKEEVKVVASRLDVTLASAPAATSVAGLEMLERMPRGVAIDEALASIPGVKIDNQANGERVHPPSAARESSANAASAASRFSTTAFRSTTPAASRPTCTTSTGRARRKFRWCAARSPSCTAAVRPAA
jgi:hypothetical protein